MGVLKGLLTRLLGRNINEEGGEEKGLQRAIFTEQKQWDEIQKYNNRHAKIVKSQTMAYTDPRISRLLYKLSADACVGGFSVVVEQTPTVRLKKSSQKVIDDLLRMTNLGDKIRSWAYSMMRDGDAFIEIVVDGDRIVKLKKLASLIMKSNMDEYGNFPEDKAYVQVHPYTKKVVAEFEQWQIVQFSWNREDGEPYGNGIFFSSQGAYDKLVASEKNMVIRRQIRAGKRLLHVVGTKEKPARWEDVNTYRQMNRDALSNPSDPVQDFWSNGLVDIKEIDTDRDIGNLADIEYLEALLAIQAGVPKALLGREENVNRDVLEEQEEDYFRVIANINNVLENGLRQIIDLALLLAGIDPSFIKYEIDWGNKDRSSFDQKIKQALTLQQLGYSFKTIYNFINLNQLPYEEEMERIKEQLESGLIPYGVNMRIDPNMATMLFGGGREDV